MSILKAKDVKKHYKPTHEEIRSISVLQDEFKLSGDGVFHTIQGEGVRIGQPTTFVRLHLCNLNCSFCLPAGTDIVVDKKIKKSIEAIEIGDNIVSYNEKSCTNEIDVVTKVMQNNTNTLYCLSLENGKTIELTGNHEVFTERGWVTAENLTEKDTLLTL